MEFGVLGPVEVRGDGGPIPIRSEKQRTLLAMLLAHPGEAVPADRLIDAVWPDEPRANPAQDLQTHVWRLRRLLAEDGRIEYRAPGYILNLAPEELDAHRLEELAAHGIETGDAALLRRALDLWRGSAYADLDHVPALREEAHRLEERRIAALQARIDAELDTPLVTDVIAELRVLAARHPLNERFHEQLILSLYRSGRQAEALTAYQGARRTLVDELGIEPGPSLRALEHAVLTQDPALNATAEVPAAWRGPRSHLTTLVGRDRERAELGGLLRERRLVTIVGMGGAGKTTLALHTAAATGVPVAVAALAGALTADEVTLAIAEPLDVGGSTLAEVTAESQRRLTGRHLLVLDNCEQVAAHCARAVQGLLAACPGLTVLATSRCPLGVPEELVWQLDGLAVPPEDDDTTTPAVELFIRRAAEAVPGTPCPPAAAARISRRLDGLPLALELAAARLRLLPADELADRLDNGLGLLSAVRHGAEPRHQTLTATIEWSYRLLQPDEQHLLARLSVFRGGFTAGAAEAVCGAPPLTRDSVLPGLAALVEHSLVQPHDLDGNRRYRLLDAVREHAGTRLDRLGETTAIADRQLDHRLAVLRRIEAAPTMREMAEGYTALAADTGNLRAALDHGFAAGRNHDATELTIRMFVFWMIQRTHHTEGAHWIDTAWPHRDAGPVWISRELRLARSVLHSERDDWHETRNLLAPIVAGLAEESSRFYPNAQWMLTNGQVRNLDPVVLPASAEAFEAARRTEAGSRHLLVLAARVFALAEWGRYEEALALCERHAAWTDGAATDELARYAVARLLAELGHGAYALAGETHALARTYFAAGSNFVHDAHLHRVTVLSRLCQDDASGAVSAAVSGIAALSALYPPTISRAWHLSLLLAEGRRRGGDVRDTLTALTTGLRGAAGGSDYATALPAVITAALLAGRIGDMPASETMAARWDQMRCALGLPAPVGYQEAVRGELGLDPAPSVPQDTPLDEPLRALLRDTLSWCEETTARLGG